MSPRRTSTRTTTTSPASPPRVGVSGVEKRGMTTSASEPGLPNIRTVLHHLIFGQVSHQSWCTKSKVGQGCDAGVSIQHSKGRSQEQLKMAVKSPWTSAGCCLGSETSKRKDYLVPTGCMQGMNWQERCVVGSPTRQWDVDHKGIG